MPERGVSLAEVAALAGGAEAGLRVTERFDPPGPAFASAVHVAAVEVDPDTGHVSVRDYAVVEDCGPVINPTIVEGQIHGAVALGIGGALLEEIRYDASGQPLGTSFMDYALPRSDDVPPIVIDHLETPSPLNPLGVKGVGESGSLPVAAVVASAVEDALTGRARVERMPLTTTELRRLLWG